MIDSSESPLSGLFRKYKKQPKAGANKNVASTPGNRASVTKDSNINDEKRLSNTSAQANESSSKLTITPGSPRRPSRLKLPSRKSPSRKSPSRKSPSRKSPIRKSPSRKSPIRKSPTRKSPSRKSPSRKSPIRKSPTRKSPTRKSPTRKSPTRKSPTRKSPVNSIGVSRIKVPSSSNLSLAEKLRQLRSAQKGLLPDESTSDPDGSPNELSPPLSRIPRIGSQKHSEQQSVITPENVQTFIERPNFCSPAIVKSYIRNPESFSRRTNSSSTVTNSEPNQSEKQRQATLSDPRSEKEKGKKDTIDALSKRYSLKNDKTALRIEKQQAGESKVRAVKSSNARSNAEERKIKRDIDNVKQEPSKIELNNHLNTGHQDCERLESVSEQKQQPTTANIPKQPASVIMPSNCEKVKASTKVLSKLNLASVTKPCYRDEGRSSMPSQACVSKENEYDKESGDFIHSSNTVESTILKSNQTGYCIRESTVAKVSLEADDIFVQKIISLPERSNENYDKLNKPTLSVSDGIRAQKKSNGMVGNNDKSSENIKGDEFLQRIIQHENDNESIPKTVKPLYKTSNEHSRNSKEKKQEMLVNTNDLKQNALCENLRAVNENDKENSENKLPVDVESKPKCEHLTVGSKSLESTNLKTAITDDDTRVEDGKINSVSNGVKKTVGARRRLKPSLVGEHEKICSDRPRLRIGKGDQVDQNSNSMKVNRLSLNCSEKTLVFMNNEETNTVSDVTVPKSGDDKFHKSLNMKKQNLSCLPKSIERFSTFSNNPEFASQLPGSKVEETKPRNSQNIEQNTEGTKPRKSQNIKQNTEETKPRKSQNIEKIKPRDSQNINEETNPRNSQNIADTNPRNSQNINEETNPRNSQIVAEKSCAVIKSKPRSNMFYSAFVFFLLKPLWYLLNMAFAAVVIIACLEDRIEFRLSYSASMLKPT